MNWQDKLFSALQRLIYWDAWFAKDILALWVFIMNKDVYRKINISYIFENLQMPNFSPPSNYDYGDKTTKGSQKL